MPMMTNVELLKTDAPDRVRAVSKIFVETAPLLRVLPMETRPVPFVGFNRQESLPGTGNRAVGEEYTPTKGTIDPGAEPMKIQGGISRFDSFQVVTGTGDRRNLEAASFVESVGRNYVRDVIKGDDVADKRTIRGLQLRLTDTNKNLFAPGVGGGKIINFQTAKDMCRKPTHWLMGKGLARRLSIAASDTTVGGFIERDQDELGNRINILDTLPIVVIDEDGDDNAILEFTEASSTTSAYCVSLGPEMMHGIQAQDPAAENLGRDPVTGVSYNTVVDWFASIILRHARSAVRYSEITDVAITLQ